MIQALKQDIKDDVMKKEMEHYTKHRLATEIPKRKEDLELSKNALLVEILEADKIELEAIDRIQLLDERMNALVDGKASAVEGSDLVEKTKRPLTDSWLDVDVDGSNKGKSLSEKLGW